MEAASWIDLSNKVAHVTGGARGIGAAIVRCLAAAGATVAVSDVDGAGAEQLAVEIGGLGMALDVSDRAAVDAALDRTVCRARQPGHSSQQRRCVPRVRRSGA